MGKLCIERWPGSRANGLQTISHAKLYRSLVIATVPPARPFVPVPAQSEFQFILDINFKRNGQAFTLLSTTLQGSDAVPTWNQGVWGMPTSADEGLGWTCEPSPTALRQFGWSPADGKFESWFHPAQT